MQWKTLHKREEIELLDSMFTLLLLFVLDLKGFVFDTKYPIDKKKKKKKIGLEHGFKAFSLITFPNKLEKAVDQ